MTEISKKVICQRTLTGRTAVEFVRQTSFFKGRIYCQKGERRVNVRSLLGVLSLGIGKGDEIILFCEDDFALEIMENYLANGG